MNDISQFDLGARLGTIDAELKTIRDLISRLIDDHEKRIRCLERFMIGAYAGGAVVWVGSMLIIKVLF